MGIKGWFLGGSYDVTVVCTNCDHTVTVRIGQGKTVESWARSAKCRVCKNRGCFQKI